MAHHVWAYDFVQARTHDGRAFRMLVVVEPLKVAAWNIENLSGNRRSDADFQRLAGYAARLDADVVALTRARHA